MGMLWPTLETMLGFAIVLRALARRREVSAGTHHRVGDFVAFNTYMVQLTWPIIALGWVINIFQRGTASLGRINEIMHGEAGDHRCARRAADPAEHARRDRVPQSELSLTNGTPVLHDINLRIPAGTSLAIVGPTGSGKTTLVSLIPRIYDADPGSVLIDGRADPRISRWQILRRNIGFVPQETFLFSETIRENIAFGVQNAHGRRDPRAAEAANIASRHRRVSRQYETLVGERGITLSGGQKQRTAIARALIRNPRILILDDALSSVDTHTEDKILNHLREVMQGRTTIFISHRVSTVRNADRIAVLHGGRIVELGTHDELLARNGYYTDLYNKQLLEEELAEV